MAQWLVTQGNQQYSVEGLDELEDLARQGRLSAGDMVQPPGTSEWMYVSEIEELAAILQQQGGGGADDVDVDYRAGRSSPSILVAVLVALIVVGGGATLYFVQQLPSGSERLIGEGGLTFSEMLVTESGSGLRQQPEERAGMAHPLQKDTVLDLLSKRGEWYRARTKAGAEGWIPADHVIPMYMLGGAEVREEFDPLYNPDRYVDVLNARWMQQPAPSGRGLSDVTTFTFLLANKSVYPMADLVIQATLKDAKGHELDTIEIPVEGRIPAERHTMVGTLTPPEGADEEPARIVTGATFEELSEADEDLRTRWVDGVEVEMTSDDEITNAEIDIIELRAVPDDEAAQVVRRDR